MKNKIVMDSAGDIQIFEGIDFSSAPLKVIADETEFSDDAYLDTKKMVNFLKTFKNKVSTSCPGVGEYQQAFGDAENIYVVTITSSLSGSYNAASVAAKSYSSQHPDRNIHVFDSLSAGPEMLLVAEKIRELVNNSLSFDDVVAQTNDYMKKTALLFSLKSLHNLAINGRIPSAVAKIIGVLGINLIGKASDDGRLQPIGKARGEKKALPELVKNSISMGYSGGKFRIAHCFNSDAANVLSSLVKEKFPGADILVYPTGGLCSFYAEEGGLLIGFEKE